MKNLVLIGNAPLALDLARFVNASDCVVRLNDCRNYASNTGLKTDILFLNNTGDPARQPMLNFFLRPRIKDEIETELPYLRGAKRVFFVRPPVIDCRSFLMRNIAEGNPLRQIQLEVISADRDLRLEITNALGLGDRSIECVTRDFYDAVWRKLLCFGDTDAIMPSTGAMALEMLRHNGAFESHRFHIAGFTHEGWEGHPWELERRLFQDYIDRGLIVRLDGASELKRRQRTAAAPLVIPQHSMNELFLVSQLKLPIFESIRQKYSGSRVVFWDCSEPDIVALRCAAALAREVIAEDRLVPALREIVRCPVNPLSHYDAQIAWTLEQDSTPLLSIGDFSFCVRGGPILFCPFNDTHVRTFAPISRLLRNPRFLLCGEASGEKAEEALRSLGIKYTRGSPEVIETIRPSVLVLAKDWSPAAESLMTEARSRGIPVACLQEGPTEFGRDRRMQQCDYPLIQGAIMLRYLEQRIYLLTGNARFDQLEPVPLPQTPTVLLNCNFWNDATSRDSWLDSAVSACRTMGINFFVSRHPRDRGDLPDLPVRRSGPEVIHSQLAECSIVITPHSSIIYEALLMGRAVICHGPQRASIDAFEDDTTGAFLKSSTSDELLAGLQTAMLPPSAEQRARIELFLDLHCGARDGKTARRCASALVAISRSYSPAFRRAGYRTRLRRLVDQLSVGLHRMSGRRISTN